MVQFILLVLCYALNNIMYSLRNLTKKIKIEILMVKLENLDGFSSLLRTEII